ncbi:MAG: zinc ribbon domain-containing protein [Planctomycetota bacterium]|jgi:hypothetical protein
MADCPKCGVEVEEASAFCESCGAALKEGVKRRKVRGRRGSLAGKIHGRNIKGARIAIMIVAVLTFLEAAATWYFYSVLKAAAQYDPDPKALAAVGLLQLVAFAVTLVAFVMLGLFFWAASNPFAASLTALVIYLTSMVVGLALNPIGLVSPIAWVIRISIITALASGVRSGLVSKRGGARPRRTRRPVRR